MNVPQGTTRSLKLIIGTLVPIAAVALCGYLVFTSGRRAYLIQRDYRALTTIVKQVQDRLDGVREAIATDERSRTLEPTNAPSTLTGVESSVVAPTGVRTSAASDGGTRIGVVLSAEGGALDAYVAYDPGCDAALARAAIEASPRVMDASCHATADRCVGTQPPAASTCSRFAIAKLLAEIVPEDALFEAIVVGLGDQQVVIKSAVPADLASELGRDAKAQAARREASPDSAPSDAGSGDATLIARLLRGRTAPAVKVYGESFLRFALPLSIPAAVRRADVLTPSLIEVEALVRETRFEQEVRRIGDGWIVALIVLLVFAALAWPVLKLWYMGPGERLRALDLRILGISILLAGGLATIAIAETARRAETTASFDRQLETFAARISRTLWREVHHATAVGEWATHRRSPSQLTYWDFERVVEIGDDASATAMWVPKQSRDGTWRLESVRPPKNLRVDDRQYYADFNAKRFWTLPEKVVGEVIRSKISGEPALAVAMPGRSGHPLVVAMRATALLHATIPYGFGYAVVERDGRVLLHSDASRVLAENFLDECFDDARLRAAVHTSRTAPLDIGYRGAAHRAVVRPIPGIPWSLVVFRDHRLLDKLNDEVVAFWALPYLFYIGGLLLVVIAGQIVNEGYRAEWIWPDRGFPRIYGPAALRLLATGVVVYLGVRSQTGLARLLFLHGAAAWTIGALSLSLAAPRADVMTSAEVRIARVVCVAGACVLLVLTAVVHDWLGFAAAIAQGFIWRPALSYRGSSSPAEDGGVLPISEGRFRFEYVSMLFMLLVVLAAVPASVLYRDATGHAITELVRFGRAAMKPVEALRVPRGGSLGPPLSNPGDAVHPVAWTCWNDPPSAGGDPPVVRPRHVPLGRFAASLLPTFGSPVPEFRALGDARHAPPEPSGCQALAATLPALGSRWWLLITLTVPAALILAALLWSIVRHVFLLDLDRFDESGPAGATQRGALNSWAFSAAGGIVAPVERSTPFVKIVDLRLPTSVDQLKTLGETLAKPDAAPVIEIDHPEAVLDDSALHDALLGLLETLVHSEIKTVVLTSEVDPVHCSAARVFEACVDGVAAASEGDKAKEDAEQREQAASTRLARWSQVLAVFTRSRWPLPPSGAATGAERAVADVLARKYPIVSSPDDAKRSADDLDEIYEARHWQIWRECTRAEKLALRQLAEEGFVSPRNLSVARHLRNRLLLRRDPAFSLVTPAFARFVVRAELPDRIAEWEAAGTQSGWARLRAPLMMLAAVAAVYLLAAAPDALNGSIALATAVAALLPTILKLFGMFGEQGSVARAR